ncbi:hypothetical protein K227x_04120 [Rubripirellula lacrimiformis]|uniref:DUF3592 domain-containing protein n=1 Tax=Rubripirellula lacrimiformis TaxID=1930273 RepID=A0A517N4I0_9BACT|nr:DUF3592 domain-containing protein [Rubripirellula lacrimiformis]QDT02041.1 hypothetical protein K227x_04120 [Rubripirellula lacrimiformis]
MNDPRHAKRDQANGPSSVASLFARQGGYAAIIVLLMVAASVVGSFVYGKIASRLNREGVITDATVLSFEEYTETWRSPNDNTDINTLHTIVTYQFETPDGNSYTDSFETLDLAEPPQIGSLFPIRYAKSDPMVNEAREGHYQRNTDAMLGIAVAFMGVTLLYVAICWWNARKTWHGPEQQKLRQEAGIE